MAEVTDVKTPYELLVRWSASGEISGAHVQYIRQVHIDGEHIKTEILPAEPIDLKDFPKSAIMKQATADALAAVERMADERKAEKTEVFRLKDQLKNSEEILAHASKENSRLAALVEQLEQKLESTKVTT